MASKTCLTYAIRFTTEKAMRQSVKEMHSTGTAPLLAREGLQPTLSV